MEMMFKARKEYCHILDDKILITKTTDKSNLVKDYGKSLNDFLMIIITFVVLIPIFATFSTILLFNKNIEFAIFFGLIGFFLFCIIVFMILFTSSTPIIYIHKIVKVTYSARRNTIGIKFKHFGRNKIRFLPLSRNAQERNVALSILKEKNILKNV